MIKATMAAGLATAILAAATPAAAQTTRQGEMWVNVDVGAQPQQRSIDSTLAFPLYEETATVTTAQAIHNGPVFGGSVGYRVKPALGVALGVSYFKARESTADAVASIPDTLLFNTFRTVTQSVSGLKHSEFGVHLQAVYFRQMNDKIEVALSAGPSVIKVKQDLISNVAVSATGLDVTLGTQSKNVFGVNAGGSAVYAVKPDVGVGLFVRYAGGKADLPSVSDLSVGGLQLGLTLRATF